MKIFFFFFSFGIFGKFKADPSFEFLLVEFSLLKSCDLLFDFLRRFYKSNKYLLLFIEAKDPFLIFSELLLYNIILVSWLVGVIPSIYYFSSLAKRSSILDLCLECWEILLFLGLSWIYWTCRSIGLNRSEFMSAKLWKPSLYFFLSIK